MPIYGSLVWWEVVSLAAANLGGRFVFLSVRCLDRFATSGCEERNLLGQGSTLVRGFSYIIHYQGSGMVG